MEMRQVQGGGGLNLPSRYTLKVLWWQKCGMGGLADHDHPKGVSQKTAQGSEGGTCWSTTKRRR